MPDPRIIQKETHMNHDGSRLVVPAAAGRPSKFSTMLAAGMLALGIASPGHAASEAEPDRPASSLLLAQAAPPAGATGASATAPRRPRNPDQSFAEEAVEGGMAEIEAGKVAQSQAAAEPVKAFARQMIADHGKANDQLKQLAVGKGITLPTSLAKRHARDLDKAAKLKGTNFDRAYMTMMVNDHKKAIALYEREARNGKDPELKGYAAALLPDLRKHLQMAQDIVAEVRKTGR
jgi:putative membrane protein